MWEMWDGWEANWEVSGRLRATVGGVVIFSTRSKGGAVGASSRVPHVEPQISDPKLASRLLAHLYSRHSLER